MDPCSNIQNCSSSTHLCFFAAEVLTVRTPPCRLFLEIDHGEWLPLFGIQRKVVRWILGNPLIAITMIRHDITAGLFVPVELLLFDNESGDGSTVMYDLPSSLMAIERNPALRDAAQELDRKLQTLVSRVTGVELDRTPEQMETKKEEEA